jgi:hypothetical protein
VLEDVINNSAGYPKTVHVGGFGGTGTVAARAPFTLRVVGSIPLKWVAAPAAGAATPLAPVGPTAGAASPTGTPACSRGPTWCSRAASGALPEPGGDHHQVHHQLRRLVTIADNLIKNALPTGAGGEGYGIMIGYPRSTNNRVINNRVEGPGDAAGCCCMSRQLLAATHL